MPKQPAFPGFRDAMKKKQTRRELFLAGKPRKRDQMHLFVSKLSMLENSLQIAMPPSESEIRSILIGGWDKIENLTITYFQDYRRPIDRIGPYRPRQYMPAIWFPSATKNKS